MEGKSFPRNNTTPEQRNTGPCGKTITSTMAPSLSSSKNWIPLLTKPSIKLVDEELDTLPIEMSEMFLDGFRLGARMMIEIYQKDFSDDSR